MSQKERAAKLLGSGVEQEVVASAIGVTPSAVSQWLAETDFAKEVADMRVLNLQEARERDSKYDKLEDRVLGKLDDMLDYMTKPREFLMAAAILNKAVRRGGSTGVHQPTVKQDVLILQMPVALQQSFVLNGNNQVVAVGERDLTTINSKALVDLAKRLPAPKLEGDASGYVIENRERILEGARS